MYCFSVREIIPVLANNVFEETERKNIENRFQCRM